MKRIRISRKVRNHLASHFGQKLPGSKFFCHSPEELLGKAQELFPEKFRDTEPDGDGRIRLSFVFPEVIGYCNVVSVSELTPEERELIQTVERQGRMVRTVRIGRRIPTPECQVILTADWHLVTMFPGEMAPPLPDSPDGHDGYWDHHVFIEPQAEPTPLDAAPKQ